MSWNCGGRPTTGPHTTQPIASQRSGVNRKHVVVFIVAGRGNMQKHIKIYNQSRSLPWISLTLTPKPHLHLRCRCWLLTTIGWWLFIWRTGIRHTQLMESYMYSKVKSLLHWSFVAQKIVWLNIYIKSIPFCIDNRIRLHCFIFIYILEQKISPTTNQRQCSLKNVWDLPHPPPLHD